MLTTSYRTSQVVFGSNIAPLGRPMRLRIMVRQHIYIPLMCEIAPDTMDMIGMVLGVVILDQKRRPFDGIVVTLATLLGTSPGAGQLVQARPLDPRPDVRAHLIGSSLDIVAEQVDQMATLLSRECGVGDAAWHGCGINHPVIPGQNIGRGDRI